jgi:hypothetical protein
MTDEIRSLRQLIAAMGNAVTIVTTERREIIVGPVFGPGVQEAKEWWKDANQQVRVPEVFLELIPGRIGGSYSLRFFPERRSRGNQPRSAEIPRRRKSDLRLV